MALPPSRLDGFGAGLRVLQVDIQDGDIGAGLRQPVAIAPASTPPPPTTAATCAVQRKESVFHS